MRIPWVVVVAASPLLLKPPIRIRCNYMHTLHAVHAVHYMLTTVTRLARPRSVGLLSFSGIRLRDDVRGPGHPLRDRVFFSA